MDKAIWFLVWAFTLLSFYWFDHKPAPNVSTDASMIVCAILMASGFIGWAMFITKDPDR